MARRCWQQLRECLASLRPAGSLRAAPRAFPVLNLEGLEDRSLLSAPSGATRLDLLRGQAVVQGALAGDVGLYALTLTESGRLTASVHADGFDTRLSLLSPAGELLVQSDGSTANNRDDLIDQHLQGTTAGSTYFLRVEALGGAGHYALTAQFVTAVPPFESLPVNARPQYLTTADLDGDGASDLATANPYDGNVSVFLGRGDGTFSGPRTFPAMIGAWEIVAADFNGDGRLDLATCNFMHVTISVLLGRGDGTFDAPVHTFVGPAAMSLQAADFDADGRTDVVVTHIGSGLSSVLRGRGDGSFEPPVQFQTGTSPVHLVLDDFNGDGRLDLAATNQSSGTVSVLLHRPDGTLAVPAQFAVGPAPGGMLAHDFNGDGRSDLAVSDTGSGQVSILIGRGDGTFADEVRYAGGPGIANLATGDFDRDGRADLASVNPGNGTISILRGRGDGTFADPSPFVAAEGVRALATADFNGDGTLDLAAGSFDVRTAHVFLARGDGTFQPGKHVSPGSGTVQVTDGDFNGDGRLDLVTSNFITADASVLLGRGDGTFQPHGRYALGGSSLVTAAGDFNGDGRLDLVAASLLSPTVNVLYGQGDGTLATPTSFAIGAPATSLVTADWNGDGRLDLAATGPYRQTVSVLLSRGDGGFEDHRDYAIGKNPFTLVGGDFNGDGRTDLVAANHHSGDLSVLLARGDGTFADEVRVPVSKGLQGVTVAADFDGDGRLDLAVTEYQARGESPVSILQGNGDGTFILATRLTAPPELHSLLAGDLDGDGQAELIVPDGAHGQLILHRRQPDGTFRVAGQLATGMWTVRGRVVDLNGDGRLDLVTANQDSSVSVLLNQGGDSFQEDRQVGITSGPVAVVEGDFNSDDRTDLATAHSLAGTVSIQIGLRNGQFHEPVVLPVGGDPRALAVADFNRDGRPGLAVADYRAGEVALLDGLGDGTFRPQGRFAVGRNPVALKARDFNGDGLPDLAVANYGSNSVSLLLGRGDGGFRPALHVGVGEGPVSLLATDLNHDGYHDLVTGNALSKDLSVLLGRGDGTFWAVARLPLPAGPAGLTAGDWNRDGERDLAIAHPASDRVSVLLGRGDGTFQLTASFTAGRFPVALVDRDFNGDLRPDLAVVNANSHDVSIHLGNGDGTFQEAGRYATGRASQALEHDDFNGDSHRDLAVVSGLGEPLSVLLGRGDGTFEPAELLCANHPAPLVGDLNGDGAADVVMLAQNGQVQFRAGVPRKPGAMEAPVVVDFSPAGQARALALVTLGGQPQIAAINARDDSLAFYAYQANGSFQRTQGPTVPGKLPSRLAAGDLNGDGRQDLVVLAPGSHTALVYMQGPAGFGNAAHSLKVGVSPGDLALVDVDGRHGLDLVIADRFGGDVLAFLNGPVAPFTTVRRYRAGAGLVGLVEHEGFATPRSLLATVGLAAGQFDADGFADLVAIHPGANRFSILRNSGQGGFLNPDSTSAFATGREPTAVATGLFDADPHLDLAILNEQSGDLSIFLGNGRGGFRAAQRVAAGNLPRGLTAHDVTGDGRLDLLVGNEFGDVLVLPGNGDGTFQPYQRAGQGIALAVADLNGDGRDDFVFGNEALDRVGVQYSQRGVSFQQGRDDGLLAPGAVSTADLNGDGVPDLVVANSGGNTLMVYLGLGAGEFASARSFFVGTNPVGLAVADVNGDGLADLAVVNAGSNDISILLGQGQGGGWTLVPGPRLRTGGGPTGLAVADVTEDGVPDLVVGSQRAKAVYVLPGVGGGFFDDRAPLILRATASPGQVFIGHFDQKPGLDVVALHPGAGGLTLFSGLGPGQFIASGGKDPSAGLAGDFNGDGLGDIVVANHDNGRFVVLLGGSEGLRLGAELVRPDLLSTSAVALRSAGGGRLEVYAAVDGREAAVSVRLALDLTPPLPPDRLVLLPLGQASADFAVLPGTSVGVVATLLTVRSERERAVESGSKATTTALWVRGEGEERAPRENAPFRQGTMESPEGTPGASPLERFLLGEEGPLALPNPQRENVPPAPAQPAQTPEPGPRSAGPITRGDLPGKGPEGESAIGVQPRQDTTEGESTEGAGAGSWDAAEAMPAMGEASPSAVAGNAKPGEGNRVANLAGVALLIATGRQLCGKEVGPASRVGPCSRSRLARGTYFSDSH